MRTTMGTLWILLFLFAADAFSDGMRAYRDGRFQEALDSFQRAEASAGEQASAELLYNLALAALRSGALVEAESAAEKAAARGGLRFAALRDFVHGNVAIARCEIGEAEANQPEAEPFAWDTAIRFAESARDAWQRAASRESDWPQARRNVERALLKLRHLQAKKEEAEKRRNADPEQKSNQSAADAEKASPPVDSTPTPLERPEPGNPDAESNERETVPNPLVAPEETELPPTMVLRLFDKLAAKDREKLQLRKTRRQAQLGSEKDW